MGNLFSTVKKFPVAKTRAKREITLEEQSSPVTGMPAPGPSSPKNGTKPGRASEKAGESSYDRSRVKSAPLDVQPMKGGENLPPLPSRRFKAKSYVASSSSGPRSETRLMGAEYSRASPRRPALTSTVRQLLPEDFRFRILVVGKSGSGKSSLIKAVFKVDVTAAPEGTLRKADINLGFHPDNNRYLIVHECSGLESRAGDSQDLQTIRDFISHRTDPSLSSPEKLHAVWLCITASDAISGRLGNGIEEILSMKSVPVVVVFTKFDLVVSQVLFDTAGGNTQHHERARAMAHTMYEESCLRIFHKSPRDVPAEIISDKPRFIDLIDNLVVTTDRFITDPRASSTWSGAQGAKQRVGAVPLAWSAALRVNHDVIIQASIEIGRSRYWGNLLFSRDFANRTLKNCVNIIHVDIVDIWNLNDKSKYLSSDRFKAKMSHIVKDLAGSAIVTSGPNPTGVENGYADWVHDVYRDSQENVRCVMGYIIDLTVILDGIFRMAADDVAPSHALQVFERHVKSGHRDAIHRDIRSFVTEVPQIRSFVPQKDLVLERIIDLIKQFCVPASGNI